MNADRTEFQSEQAIERAKELSQQQVQPPADVPGYETQRFLGSGAYGEVWVGVDKTTGRRVAIKFYTHGSRVDWSLLSREVEKLAVLSADRYVVQLLDVGWDATPPYYVMDYIENGSLEDALVDRGHFSVADAVELFEEVAIGLRHLHSKGVLHCDLKPANVLLDEDDKPRLADFGQSRLSHEQAPALGTLFYMAPEQADLKAVPDARWDVYALGAILFRMLTGNPPHRTEDNIDQIQSTEQLVDRLVQYRTIIESSRRPNHHRQLPGVDGALADIIDRCLAPDPKNRFPSVESVIEALHRRAELRTRRPLMILGLVLPVFLLFVMALFGLRGYHAAMKDSEEVVTERVRESNRAQAEAVAANVAREMERYFFAIESVTNDPAFIDDFEKASLALDDLSRQLSDPTLDETRRKELRAEFLYHEKRKPLQDRIEAVIQNSEYPPAASWITTDHRGTHLADEFNTPIEPEKSPIGKNYGWRTYFTGLEEDLPRDKRPEAGTHITETFPSPVFQSTVTFTWKIAITGPVYKYNPATNENDFLGIVGVTVEMGSFTRSIPVSGGTQETTSQSFTVLVGGRAQRGVILQHPLFEKVLETEASLPKEFSDSRYHVKLDKDLGIRGSEARRHIYKDPLGKAPGGKEFDRDWIAATVPVTMYRGRRNSEGSRPEIDTGLIVLVQEDHEAAIAPVHQLGEVLVREGVVALAIVISVIMALWFFVVRFMSSGRLPGSKRATPTEGGEPSPGSMPTLALGKRDTA